MNIKIKLIPKEVSYDMLITEIEEITRSLEIEEKESLSLEEVLFGKTIDYNELINFG
jgi:hypothetical protein